MSAHETHNPAHPEKHKPSLLITFVNLLSWLTLAPWLLLAFASLFLLDAPDAAENSLFMTALLLIWLYPPAVIISTIFSRRSKIPANAALLATAPFLHFAIIILMLFTSPSYSTDELHASLNDADEICLVSSYSILGSKDDSVILDNRSIAVTDWKVDWKDSLGSDGLFVAILLKNNILVRSFPLLRNEAQQLGSIDSDNCRKIEKGVIQ